MAAYAFGLTLYPSGSNTHDGQTEDGRKVQVKLTGGIRGIGLSSEPDYLIVLQLRDYKFSVVYNGLGAPVWSKCSGDPELRGQRHIALALLRKLQPDVSPIQIKDHGFPNLGMPQKSDTSVELATGEADATFVIFQNPRELCRSSAKKAFEGSIFQSRPSGSNRSRIDP